MKLFKNKLKNKINNRKVLPQILIVCVVGIFIIALI